MPYHIVKHGGRWCVEKSDGSNKSMGCHDTEAAAKKQMAALYASEPKAARSNTPRCLHLVGAAGKIRTAEFNKVEHLVVPVVAMVEGVVWAVNSDVPEFVPAEELAETPHQWNGRGCFAGHPRDGNTQVTANTPRTLEHSFGVIFNVSPADRILKTRRLEMEAWLDPAKAETVGPEAVDVIRRLRAYQANPGSVKPVEVSVGCYVEAEQKDGSYNGLAFHGVWRNIVSDHLAFLAEDQEGACSVAAGCGAPRAAVKHFVTAEGIRREVGMTEPRALSWLLSRAGRKSSSTRADLIALLESRMAEGLSDADVRRAIDNALRAVEPGYLGIDSVYPDDKTVIYYVMPKDEWIMKRRGYKMSADGSATVDDDAVEVEPVTTYEPVTAAAAAAAAATAHTPIPASTSSTSLKVTGGTAGTGAGKSTVNIHIDGKKVAAAAVTSQLKAADCGCKGAKTMSNDKTSRAELIAALVTDKYSGFKDGDEALLEAASDARLEEFRSAADNIRVSMGTIARLETENRNVAARLKVAEDRLRVAESPMTDEDFRQRAPEGIKKILDAVKAEEDQLRASLVSQLKDLGAHSEEDLKKKPISELQTLAQYARIEVPDFSGRGIPRLKAAENNTNDDFTPPDPYAEGLKALRGQRVN